jgi:hypothetical protein
MERLDQGHLHPKLRGPETNMSRPGIKLGPEASILAKSCLNSVLISIRNIYICVRDTFIFIIFLGSVNPIFTLHMAI